MESWDDRVFRDSPTWSIQSDYGIFHVYAVTMTLGVIIAIACAAFQFKRKGLRLEMLMIGAVAAVPAGLFGGSIFGKLDGAESFWSLFAFWNAGMSIHGAILLGGGFGILVFYIIGRKERVSVLVYMDFILPHILLSQAIGRWGNFFNHEIIGKPAGLYSEGAMSWLPSFIRDNVTFKYAGPSGSVINGISLESGNLYVMHPIFLYESISFIVLWALIMFLIPAIKNWTKNVPWRKDPLSFPTKKTAIPFNKIIKSEQFEPKKYHVISTLDQDGVATEELFYMKKSDIWQKAFYSNVDPEAVENYQQYLAQSNNENKFKKRWNDGKALYKANNPQQYQVVKAGVQAGAYFFCWNFVRLILETQRPVNNLFIKENQVLSCVLVGLTAALGIILIVMSEFVTPYLLRKNGFIYEKEYFYTKEAAENSVKSGFTKFFFKKKSPQKVENQDEKPKTE